MATASQMSWQRAFGGTFPRGMDLGDCKPRCSILGPWEAGARLGILVHASDEGPGTNAEEGRLPPLQPLGLQSQGMWPRVCERSLPSWQGRLVTQSCHVTNTRPMCTRIHTCAHINQSGNMELKHNFLNSIFLNVKIHLYILVLLKLGRARWSGSHHDQGGQAFQLSRLVAPSRAAFQAWVVGRAWGMGSAT